MQQKPTQYKVVYKCGSLCGRGEYDCEFITMCPQQIAFIKLMGKDFNGKLYKQTENGEWEEVK